MTRKQMIQYANKFNVASFEELNTWPDKRLADTVQFIKDQLQLATSAQKSQ